MTDSYDPDGSIGRMVEPLFQTMERRGATPFEVDLMHKAYYTALTAHHGQRRKSGEPYIIHPIAVARIVGEEMELGPNVVCAAFLHDVVEDTPYTIEQVADEFGEKVAFLVEAVTKKKKKDYFLSKQVDNYKHMLDSLKQDPSPLLLKLADRLHNMRTLQSMAPAKQMKIAGETDYFYAPLAFRLGYYRVKTELENLSFRYRCPREYETLERQLRDESEHIRPYLTEFKDRVAQRLADHGVSADINIVTRQPYSVYRKMQRKNVDFQHLERLHSVHIVYDSPDRASEKALAVRIYRLLTDVFKEKPHSVTNYIDNPKENGYQSLHVHVMAGNGHWQEVRISSRRMARNQNFGCLASYADTHIGQWLERLKANVADMVSQGKAASFMDGVRASFYNDDIVVYTIDGEQHMLPEKASVLDLAFLTHPSEALHTEYALVNGKLRSALTVLDRGDIVELGFNPSVTPDADWIDHVVTYAAKSRLRAWLDARDPKRVVRCQHCKPLPGDEVVGFNQPDGTVMVHKRDCQVAISEASQHGDDVVPVDFVDDGTPYLVNFKIEAVDRYHLLSDIIECITERLRLSIDSLDTVTRHHIVTCVVNFYLYSYDQLQQAITSLNAIPGVHSVSRAY